MFLNQNIIKYLYGEIKGMVIKYQTLVEKMAVSITPNNDTTGKQPPIQNRYLPDRNLYRWVKNLT